MTISMRCSNVLQLRESPLVAKHLMYDLFASITFASCVSEVALSPNGYEEEGSIDECATWICCLQPRGS